MNQTMRSLKKNIKKKWRMPLLMLPLSFFLVEAAGWLFLREGAQTLWPLAFGALWAVVLTGLLRALPGKAARVLYGITYFPFSFGIYLISFTAYTVTKAAGSTLVI